MAKARPVELHEGESIIEEVKALYIYKSMASSDTGREGMCTLTNESVIYTPNDSKLNSGMETIRMDYDTIAEVKKAMLNFIVPMGVKIILKDGTVHILSISKRNKWIELIQSQMNK